MERARRALANFDDASTETGNLDEIFVTQHPDGYEPRDHAIWRRLTEQQRVYLPAHAIR